MNACTIIARNYLPFARVLADSFHEHHPGGRFTVLVVDDVAREVDGRSDGFEVLRPADIDLPDGEFNAMAMIYDVTELSTAVKPWLLRYLLRRGESPITYFDPDIWIFASLEDVADLAKEHSIVLTPHTLTPMTQDDRTPREVDILAAGVFNLGFIALGPGSEEFLDWWAQRLRRDAVRDVDRQLFTDQRWVDFLPGYWPHHILRDEGCNVAYWNLDSRDLAVNEERYLINGGALRFFHFSGYDPDLPFVLSKHHAERPRILLSEHPAIARICREYAGKLRDKGYRVGSAGYGFDLLPNRMKVDRIMRRTYRSALGQEGLEAAPPDPFDPQSTDAFVEWLNAPMPADGRNSVSRYLYELYLDRPDLCASFRRVPGADTGEFIRWVHDWGKHDLAIDDRLLPARHQHDDRRRSPSAASPGINVVGYFRAEAGTGEAARLVAKAVEASGIPFGTVVNDQTTSRQAHPFEDRAGEWFDTNLLCVNADQVSWFAHAAGAEFFRGRYTIGLWHWEVEQFPTSLYPAFGYVDEVWVASEFARRAVAESSPRPVFSFPLPIIAPQFDGSVSRRDLDLPDGYMFLFIFDFLSVFERKNPLAVIEAFSRAFRPDEGPDLVIKTVNAEHRAADAELLRLAAAERPDVHLIERYFSSAERNALLHLCDCYASLHRAEGFGLTMAEAMAIGKPVIATGYSGNLEFMNDGNSFLVPFQPTIIPRGCDPYPAGAAWAAPDIRVAAAMMRGLVDDPVSGRERGRRAQEDISTLHGPAARSAFVGERFEAIQRVKTMRSYTRFSGSDLSPRGGAGPFQASARLLLRALVRPVEFIRYPPSRYARPAAAVRRVARRPFRSVWRAANATVEMRNRRERRR
jgi:glycosyltransferase involved in cell wall biosynthesis